MQAIKRFVDRCNWLASKFLLKKTDKRSIYSDNHLSIFTNISKLFSSDFLSKKQECTTGNSDFAQVSIYWISSSLLIFSKLMNWQDIIELWFICWILVGRAWILLGLCVRILEKWSGVCSMIVWLKQDIMLL